MANLNRDPEPATHPELIESLAVAADRLREWHRRNGYVGAHAPTSARIWGQLLDQSHRLAKQGTAPAILKQDLGAPLGMKITKEKWMSFLSWWEREIRDDYFTACQSRQLPILYPVRSCDSKGGYSESRAAIYFLSLLGDSISATERSDELPSRPTSLPPEVDEDRLATRPSARTKERTTADADSKVRAQRPITEGSTGSSYRPITLALQSLMVGPVCSANNSLAMTALLISVLLIIFFFQLEYTILSLWAWLADQLGALSGLFKIGIFATL